jgi:hypothetical protein
LKEVEMGKRDWTLLGMKKEDRSSNYINKSFYIQNDIEQTLTALSVMTGVEMSLLVNEAIGDLIEKYQPLTAIDPLKKMLIQ